MVVLGADSESVELHLLVLFDEHVHLEGLQLGVELQLCPVLHTSHNHPSDTPHSRRFLGCRLSTGLIPCGWMGIC